MLTAPRSFSQLATSFIAFLCLGIPTHALSSLTIKFPVAPAFRILRPSCRYGLRLRLLSVRYRLRARPTSIGFDFIGNLIFLSRFTSDLFQTLRTRLLASRTLPSRRFPAFPVEPASLRRTCSLFCPSSSSVFKDLSRFTSRCASGFPNSPCSVPYAEKGTLSIPCSGRKPLFIGTALYAAH